MTDENLEIIAGRVERIADRYRNADDVEGEQRARQIAQAIRACRFVYQALEIERQFSYSLHDNYDISSLKFSGEYDDQEPAVDFDFISELEGGRKLSGYIPDAVGSKSGVTVATGVDLGQRSESDIDKLDIPDELKDKLKPYTELTGKEAEDFLKGNPLDLTEAEAEALDRSVKEPAIGHLD
jgi:hypothetical protein